MLRTTTKLTKREEEFLTWLLDPQLFGQRTPGLTSTDGKKIARAISQLQRVSRPELLSAEIQALLACLAQLGLDLRARRTVHRSQIQGWSHEGTENIDEIQRFFLATLIARKRGAKPYEFLRDFLAKSASRHLNAKAIEMRVSRFERRLTPVGWMSCPHIINMKYSQFLTLRRQKRFMTILSRYLKGKMNYRRYIEESKRTMWANTRESDWLASLCPYAAAPTATESVSP